MSSEFADGMDFERQAECVTRCPNLIGLPYDGESDLAESEIVIYPTGPSCTDLGCSGSEDGIEVDITTVRSNRFVHTELMIERCVTTDETRGPTRITEFFPQKGYIVDCVKDRVRSWRLGGFLGRLAAGESPSDD